jgi:hypothetical protein
MELFGVCQGLFFADKLGAKFAGSFMEVTA